MLKLFILLTVVTFTVQDPWSDCRKNDEGACQESVNCKWYGETYRCLDIIYEQLGEQRTLTQRAYFVKEGQTCNVNIKNGDFIAQKSFHFKEFRQFCKLSNIEAIRVDSKFYKTSQLLNVNYDSAIIYPFVPMGAAVIYSKRNYDGKSWLITGPTKLYGQEIRSIKVGLNTLVSIYNKHGQATQYTGITRNTYRDADGFDHGVESILEAEEIEYIKLELIQ